MPWSQVRLRREVGGQAFHLAGKAFQRGLGPVAVHLREGDKAGPALDQSADGGPVGGAFQEITLLSAGRRLSSNRRKASGRGSDGRPPLRVGG